MKRLKDPLTTILGLVIFLPTVALVWFGKATLTEAVPFVAIATALFFSKDKPFMDNFLKRGKE